MVVENWRMVVRRALRWTEEGFRGLEILLDIVRASLIEEGGNKGKACKGHNLLFVPTVGQEVFEMITLGGEGSVTTARCLDTAGRLAA
jgi:hypothetical protein